MKTKTNLKINIMLKRLEWHYDAIVNGGATIIDCIKVEINIWFKKDIFDI